MNKDSQLWKFISGRLGRDERVILLIVAESSGSSPGRAGYKMAVASDDELCGSIGGGLMEVNLVEKSRSILSEPGATGFFPPQIIEQVHQKNSPQASGMICSGRQTVLMVPLTAADSRTINRIVHAVTQGEEHQLTISEKGVVLTRRPDENASDGISFPTTAELEFRYSERLGHFHRLYIIGGGHCALALSELASKLDFRITIFDDRPGLNTIEKNCFAEDIRLIENYENIGTLIPAGSDVYVVVMTLGYASDEIAIRSLVGKDVKYLGILGSKAKMKVLLKTLEKEGIDPSRLSRIRTPIGLPINSHSPDEIAVSIAAEIISVKNA